MSPHSMAMQSVVREFGRNLKRSATEIDGVIEKLTRHWVSSLDDWRRLTIEKRRQIALPLLLQHKIDEIAASEPTEEGEPCTLRRTNVTISCELHNYVYELSYEHTLELLLTKISGDTSLCGLFTSDNVKIDPQTPISIALIPGNKFVIGNTSHILKAGYNLSTIEVWLQTLGMEKYGNLFYYQNVDDFFTLPFLRADILETMGITNADDRKKIMECIKDIRNTDPHKLVGQWVFCLGFETFSQKFVEQEIDLHVLLLLKESDILSIFPNDKELAQQVYEKIDQYSRFSSVEETFRWLQRNGFEKYSFHFARYNIPFYALPFVNFFIINEIGVTSEDQKLLNALQKLKESPAYNIKGIAYWLRDLEMEKYNLIFANNLLFNLETLTVLNDSDIDRLVTLPADRDKMRLGIQEMKEFQFYYSATASLLQELGMDRYSELFAHHGISIDILPFLSDTQLREMGITDASDRDKIMTVVRKLKSFIPIDDNKPSLRKAPPRRLTSRRLKSKDTERTTSILGPDIKSVEEWLAFINDDSRPIVVQEPLSTPKAQAKRTKKKKKKTTRASSVIGVPPTITSKPLTGPPIRLSPSAPSMISENEKTSDVSKQLEALKEFMEDMSLKPTKSQPQSPQLSKPGLQPSNPSPKLSAIISSIKESGIGSHELTRSAPDPSFIPSSGSSPDLSVFDEEEEFDDLDDMDPELKAQLDKEVEEFRLRLESVNQYSKSKLAPIFYLPD